MSPDTSTLADRLEGPLIAAGADGFETETAGFNTAVSSTAGLVVGAASADDVVAAVRFAAENGLRVGVQSTGHGPPPPAATDLLITTGRLDEVSVDGDARLAKIGAGVRWQAVYEAASAHGLAPITGSSATVGVVGYLLGGGLGPLARSHGFSSDYVVSFEVVNGAGELLTASAGENEELYWALRGGKAGLGIVTAVELRLVELKTLYAGSLMFEAEHIEQALRAWIAWTASADPRITTSVAIVRFPPFEQVPEPIRGRNLLSLRFAFPGPSDEGERLAQPLRDAAPVYIDDVGEMVPTEMARISGDPTEPAPSWISARLLGDLDDGFATALLAEVGPEATPPFVAVEVRHIGSAAATDVEQGSAASGRGATFTIGMVGVDPSQFETGLPEAAARIYEGIGDYLSDEGNPNFSAKPKTMAEFESAFTPATRSRLADVRSKFDPDGVIALWD